jgi:hypothetical protein
VPSIALIAACSSRPDTIQPGQWEMVTQMTTVEAPGAPEPVVAQMRAAMANQRQTQSTCITPEQARNPSRNMVGQGNNAAGCEFSDTTFAGGNIRIRANCRPPGAGQMEMSVEGDYTATTMNGRINVNMTAPPGAGVQQIRMSGTLTGRRTGDCAR